MPRYECFTCGKKITRAGKSKKSTRHYCNKECFKNASIPDVICKLCGEPIKTPVPMRRYCDKCKNINVTYRKHTRNNRKTIIEYCNLIIRKNDGREKQAMKIIKWQKTRKCVICGKEATCNLYKDGAYVPYCVEHFTKNERMI